MSRRPDAKDLSHDDEPHGDPVVGFLRVRFGEEDEDDDEEESDEVSAIRHNYQHIIKTQIHNHLESHKCLEIFVLHGDAKKVKELLRAFEKNTKVELVRSIIV